MSEQNVSTIALPESTEKPIKISEKLYLFGFRIDPDREEPEIYTLFIYGEQERPLVADGNIVFFSRPDLILSALKLCEIDTSQLGIPPTEVSLVCDIAETLHLISYKDIDDSATILNCLNTVFDLVKATSVPLPNDYKRVLYSLADHLTFEQEFASFLTQNDIKRSMIENAIMWCMGAVMSKSKLLR
jgi:hypothetical protein